MKFYTVIISDPKGNYIYDVDVKALNKNDAIKIAQEAEDEIYKAASDIGVVNLDSEFGELEKYEAEPCEKCPPVGDIAINNNYFTLKNGKLSKISKVESMTKDKLIALAKLNGVKIKDNKIKKSDVDKMLSKKDRQQTKDFRY